MTKKLLQLAVIIIVIGAVIFIVKGTDLFNDGKESLDRVKNEATNVFEKFRDAKNKVNETTEDVQNAYDEVKKATDTVSEITK